MADEKTEDKVEITVPIHVLIMCIMLAAILTTQIWFGFWLWRIDKFLVVMAIGHERLEGYSEELKNRYAWPYENMEEEEKIEKMRRKKGRGK